MKILQKCFPADGRRSGDSAPLCGGGEEVGAGQGQGQEEKGGHQEVGSFLNTNNVKSK